MNRQKRTIKRQAPSGVNAVAALVGTGLAAAGGWIVYSNVGVDHQVALPTAVDASRATFYTPATGEVSYYFDRSAPGRPLVLVHSVNAAASAFEMRALFEHYRRTRPVFAIDLPGFGFSERSDRQYTPQLFQAAITELLGAVVQEPADVVALSLGGEFAALAAAANSERFHSLTLISPSGFSRATESEPAEQADRRSSQATSHRLLTVPLWSRPLYDLIATKASIAYYLNKSFVGPVPQEMVEYAYVTSHQPGAQHAPLYFLSGQLFTPNVRTEVYARLEMPCLVLYDQDPFVTFERLAVHLDEHPNWRSDRIAPTLGLPHIEKTSEALHALDRFWGLHG